MLQDILKRGDYITKVDLKDAYFMEAVHQKHQNLTRLTWKGKAYQFSCLPFGLSSPWVYTKITRPIMTTLRTMGLRTIMYIDDIENLGLVINHPKSQTTPSQTIDFLGFGRFQNFSPLASHTTLDYAR